MVSIENEALSLFFILLLPISLWLVYVSTGIFVWEYNIGLKLAGCCSLVLIWAITLGWRYQGNLIVLSLHTLTHPNALAPIWWLYFFLFTFPIMIVINLVIYIVKTFQILAKEWGATTNCPS
jgi:hypothetical protein